MAFLLCDCMQAPREQLDLQREQKAQGPAERESLQHKQPVSDKVLRSPKAANQGVLPALALHS